MTSRAAVLCLLAGLMAGELDPIGYVSWKVIGRRLPAMKAASLDAPSPFAELPRSQWILESPNAFVVENRHAPVAPVHLLVVPKVRYHTLLEAPPAVLGEMLNLATKAAEARGIAESGFRVVVNTNPQGAQTVYHLHMHVIGGEQLGWPLVPELRAAIRGASE